LGEEDVKCMPNKKELPIVYEIILKKMVDKLNASQRLNSGLNMQDITLIFGKIFHIPKKYHYAVIREFEEFGFIKINRTEMELLTKKFKE